MQNLEKALRLLNLPTEIGAINGQINKRTTKALVENCLMDFTKMVKNPTTGKFEPTTTYTYVIESSESLFGAYPFNLIAGHIHSSGMEITNMENNSFTLYKPYKEFTIDTILDSSGQVVNLPAGSGVKSWVGWTEIKIVPTAKGYDYNFYYEQGFNSYFGVYYAHNENITWRSLLRRTYVKTSSTPNPTRFTKSYPKYTIAQLKQKTGFTDYQLAEAFGTTWHVELKDHNTHCLNIASDIVFVDENTIKGEAYINGVLSKDIPFTSLISSYFKTLPDFVCRYKLYNSKFTTSGDNAYGTAWNKFYSSTQDTTLNLQKGDVVSYNATTNTLTYPPDSKLVFDFEFLPAQGKNETNGTAIDLDTMVKELFV
jgi:hypothetical protein